MFCRAWVILALSGLVIACSEPTAVAPPEVVAIVARDGVPFPAGSVPTSLVERLSSQQVVLIGEMHFLKEHGEFVSDLARDLHSLGFRQVLLEWPQMADWVLADFVSDGGVAPGWEPPASLSGSLIRGIRDLNRSLPAGEQVRLRGIDVNLSDYGGASSFRQLLRDFSERLPDPGPIASFLGGDYSTPGAQENLLKALRGELNDGSSTWAASWGDDRFETVLDMVETEIASVPVRALREDHYDMSVRLRENVMKRLSDLRIRTGGRSIINVGSNHAQKSFLRGTEQEWLGDYLVHQSDAAGGDVFVVAVAAARIDPLSGGAAYYPFQNSPENELFRVMHESSPESRVFLPLDDPQFREGGVRLSFEETIYTCAPKAHYDGLVVLPLAHRVPVS